MSSGREDSELKDIDTLLDQIEVKFLTNREKYNPNRTVAPLVEARQCPCTAKTSTNWSEVDELLNDLEIHDEVRESRTVGSGSYGLNGSKVKKVSNGEATTLRCLPPYLAGSYEPMGYSSPGFEKSCNRLGCLQCDFDVEVFDNFCWDPSTDYLFLRTHMPTFDKVAQKLVKRKGTRAYACQCQYVSINKLTNLGSLPQLKWICKKHSI